MADLDAILLRAYEHKHLGGADPIIHTFGMDKASLIARRDELRAVEARCYVSLVQRQFLDRAIVAEPVFA